MVAARTEKNTANMGGRLHLLTYGRSVDALQYLIFRFKTSSKPLKFYMRFLIEREAEIIFHRVLSFLSPGTEIYPVNANRLSSRASYYQAYVDPVLTGIYEELIIPSLGTDTGRGLHFQGSQIFYCGDFIFKKNSEYFIALRNLDTTYAAHLGIFLTSIEV